MTRIAFSMALLLVAACGATQRPRSPEGTDSSGNKTAVALCIDKISQDACPVGTALACEEKALQDCKGQAAGSVIKQEGNVSVGCLNDTGVLYACKAIHECANGATMTITKDKMECGK